MSVMGNMYNMCRLCALESRKSTLVSIFSSTGLENHLPDKINCHLPIKVSKDDGYPQAVCQTCIKKLNICHELISTCVKANNKIQQLVNDIAKLEWVSRSDDDQVECDLSREEEFLLTQEVIVIEVDPEHEQHAQALDNMECTEKFDKPTKISAKRSDDTDSASEIEDVMGQVDHNYTQDPEVNNSDNQNQDQAAPQEPEPEIALVVVASHPDKDLKELDSTSELFLVSMAYSDFATYEERLEAARNTVDKKKNLPTTVVQASSDDTALTCSSCGLDFKCPPNLDSSQEQQTVQCEHCGHLNVQESAVLLNPLNILKELVYHIYTSVETFERNPLECGVTMLGKYSEGHEAFVLTNHPPKSADISNINIRKYISYESEKTICYLCGICYRNLPFTKEYFTKHLITEHFGAQDASKELDLTCTICAKTFTLARSLDVHLKFVHGDKRKTDREKLMCDECGKLVIKRGMSMHKQTHLRRECSYCHEIVAIRTWRRHKQYQENPNKADLKVSCVAKSRKFGTVSSTIACEYCNVVLERKYWMYHHAYQASFGPNIKCPEVIPTPEEKQRDPENQALFEAKLKRAAYFWNLRRESIMNNGLSYAYRPKTECPVCHKLLSHFQYKNHVDKHYGNLPFECSWCSKKFASKTLLSRHMKFVHIKIGLNCQYCNKFFEKRSKLESHEALHRGERNFKCPLCPKYFSGPPNVYGHIKLVHEGRYKGRKRNQRSSANDNDEHLEIGQVANA